MWWWIVASAAAVGVAAFTSQRLGWFGRTGRAVPVTDTGARAEAALRSLSDAVVTTDCAGVVDYLNPVAERLLERAATDAVGQPLSAVVQLVDEITGRPVSVPLQACGDRAHGLRIPGDLCLISASGRRHPVTGSVAPMRDHDGAGLGMVITLQDVSRAREIAHLLAHRAAHDDLTGLLNRREFAQRVQQAIDSVQQMGRHHVLCYMDLDQFRVINDTCGHLAGDALLKQLAALLAPHVRETDTLARLGGDEFGILFWDCEPDDALVRVEELRETVRKFRFSWDDKTFEIGVSIGMVPLTKEHRTMTEAMSLADSACYVAKEQGGGRVHIYQADDVALIRRHGEMQWVHRITQAYSESRFVLYAQEVVPLLNDQSGQRFEVLLRMLDEANELVLPMEYIRAAERYNLMADLDRWVISNALALIGTYLARRRDDDALPVRRFAINLSGQSLGDDRTLEFVRHQFEKYPGMAPHIVFEITETAAVSNLAHATSFIASLRELGCSFALDDFGTGVSSFAHLKNLDVDYLKIDGSFVRDIGFDPVDYAMVGSINHIGHVMNIATIAEYVENQDILEKLRDLGVDYGQGNWLSKPVKLVELVNS